MRHVIGAALALFLAPWMSAVTPRSASAQATDSGALATAERYLDALRQRDTAAVRALLHPSMRIVTVLERGGAPVLAMLGADELVRTVGRAQGEPWNQRLHAPAVRRDGDLAAIWAEYSFHRGTAFDHCGAIALDLVRQERGWVIVHVSDTHRVAGCDAAR